ncbi:leucine-rich repeat protein, partial [Metamycoplasma hyosynoviae]|uniref:leucine-rich repeat protein n=1 Tax=Metamycoplasma hyosynoviae TaxID=29559 RepID=UPI00235F2D44
ALYGIKLKKIILKSTTVHNIENLFSYSNEKLEELDLTDMSSIKNFNVIIPSKNNIKKLSLPKNMVENITFTFQGWKQLEEVKLPSSTKRIQSNLFYECDKLKKINFDELINLEEICREEGASNYLHFISSNQMEKIDLSNTKLKKLAGYVFPFMPKLNEIIFPATLQEVGKFITYTSSQNDDIIIDHLINIKIKTITEKPQGWSDKWIGKYWDALNQKGTETSKVNIQWNDQ